MVGRVRFESTAPDTGSDWLSLHARIRLDSAGDNPGHIAALNIMVHHDQAGDGDVSAIRGENRADGLGRDFHLDWFLLPLRIIVVQDPAGGVTADCENAGVEHTGEGGRGRRGRLGGYRIQCHEAQENKQNEFHDALGVFSIQGVRKTGIKDGGSIIHYWQLPLLFGRRESAGVDGATRSPGPRIHWASGGGRQPVEKKS